ncbi:hypothetical protein, partial [Shigella flexneri]|uniref:hypothetical protein n=1 Tax=Shigella flexneri TaxID=623 RepID=UPI000A5E8B02
IQQTPPIQQLGIGANAPSISMGLQPGQEDALKQSMSVVQQLRTSAAQVSIVDVALFKMQQLS